MAQPFRPFVVRSMASPVTIVDVVAPDSTWNTSWGPHPLDSVSDTEDKGRCYLCNQPLSWRVVVAEAGGARHVLGRDCAAKAWPSTKDQISYLANRAEASAKAEAARLEALAPVVELLEARRADLAAKPHPMASKPRFKKRTLADYGTWWVENLDAEARELRRVLGTLQEALGIESAAQAELRERKAAQLQAHQAQALELAAEIRMWTRELQNDPKLEDLARRLLIEAVAKLSQIPSAVRPQEAREAMEAAGLALQAHKAPELGREGAA